MRTKITKHAPWSTIDFDIGTGFDVVSRHRAVNPCKNEVVGILQFKFNLPFECLEGREINWEICWFGEKSARGASIDSAKIVKSMKMTQLNEGCTRKIQRNSLFPPFWFFRRSEDGVAVCVWIRS